MLWATRWPHADVEGIRDSIIGLDAPYPPTRVGSSVSSTAIYQLPSASVLFPEPVFIQGSPERYPTLGRSQGSGCVVRVPIDRYRCCELRNYQPAPLATIGLVLVDVEESDRILVRDRVTRPGGSDSNLLSESGIGVYGGPSIAGSAGSSGRLKSRSRPAAPNGRHFAEPRS